MARLVAAVAGIAAAVLLVTAAPAAAHALPQSSDPPAGATLKEAPTAVTITFGESPDPRLSSIRVLDAAGQDHTSARTGAVPGDARALRVALGKLGTGVYTVSWRTVSDVDGHLAAGTFSFGVGVTPTAAVRLTSKAPNPSVASVVSRWLFYGGLMVLVGGAFVALVCYETVPTRLAVVLVDAAALALVAAGGITFDSRRTAQVAWSHLAGSSLGGQLAWRAVPLTVGLALMLAVVVVRRETARRALVAAGALSGLAAMWGDIEASHAAAARSLRLLRMADQWAHFAAAAVWVGGLAALVVTIGAIPAGDRSRATRRFSTAALICVAVIAASGFERAYDEVGTLHRLVHAAFGQYVLAKVGLLAVLVVLGAVNRYRALPTIAGSARLLRRVGTAELVGLAAVLGVTGILQGLAPPTSAATPAVHPLVVHGHDFGTTVNVTLAITPGLAGFNQFVLTVADFDTGRPVDGTASLRFALPARADLGSSTLALARTQPGVFAAQGPNLSIEGTWTVDVVIQQSSGGIDIPLAVTPIRPPQKIVVAPQGSGLPTLYTLELSGNRAVQTYLDPGHPGFNEFHLTFVGADGNEAALTAVTVDATPPGATAPVPLTVRRLDPVGHFVADLPGATRGTYRFAVNATTPTGDTIGAAFTIPVR